MSKQEMSATTKLSILSYMPLVCAIFLLSSGLVAFLAHVFAINTVTGSYVPFPPSYEKLGQVGGKIITDAAPNFRMLEQSGILLLLGTTLLSTTLIRPKVSAETRNISLATACAGLVFVVGASFPVSGDVKSVGSYPHIVTPTVLVSFLALATVLLVMRILSSEKPESDLKEHVNRRGNLLKYGSYLNNLLLYASLNAVVWTLLWIYLATSNPIGLVFYNGLNAFPQSALATWVLLVGSLIGQIFFSRRGLFNTGWHLGYLSFLAGAVGWASLGAGCLVCQAEVHKILFYLRKSDPLYPFLSLWEGFAFWFHPNAGIYVSTPILFFGGIALTLYARRKMKPKKYWRAYFGGMLIGWSMLLQLLIGEWIGGGI